MNFTIDKGSLKYGKKSILSGLSPKIRIFEPLEVNSNGIFLEFSKDLPFATAYWQEIKISSLKRFMALYRSHPYWYRPHFGIKESQIPERTVFILCERIDDQILIIIPLIDKGYNFYLNGIATGLEVMADNNCRNGHFKKLIGLYVAIGQDPYELLEMAAGAVSKFVNVGKLKKEKELPEWVDYLGYCTWNTFYLNINQENTLRMLKHVKKNNVKIGFFLLDDGWQVARFRTLMDKGVNKKKFPEGLKKYISTMRNYYGVKFFIIWHTMQGYWHGISLIRGRYRKKFKVTRNVPHYGISNPKKVGFFQKLYLLLLKAYKALHQPLGILLPNEVGKFWDDYHGWLASQGVDGVKVDNQSGTEIHFYNMGYQATMMRKLHKALEKSVSKHFSKYSIINCMSQNTNVYYQLIESNITRNSDDYFPKNEKSQPEHVLINAYNNIWCGQFSLPDWDMFQSKHPWGAYQAAARAISGSPIYFADNFGEMDVKIISKISLPNGKVLRCEDIALPCRDVLFQNPAKPQRALKVFNHNKYNSVLGIFNALLKRSTKTTYSPADIEGVDPNGNYAVFGTVSGSLAKMKYLDSVEVELKAREFEIFTISQIKNGFAPIGLIDKYNPGGIFDEIIVDKNKILIKVKLGGKLGFHSEIKPVKVLVDNKEAEFDFDSKQEFLKIESQQQESQNISIFYETYE